MHRQLPNGELVSDHQESLSLSVTSLEEHPISAAQHLGQFVAICWPNTVDLAGVPAQQLPNRKFLIMS